MSIDHAAIGRTGRSDDPPHDSARQRYVRVTLAIAGVVGVLVGAAITLAPRSFVDAGGPTADLLSETRAPGGALLAVGAFVLVAAIRRTGVRAAAIMATLTYLGYGLARTLSLVLDGLPSATVVAATIVELAIGIAALVAVIGSPDGPPARRHTT